MGRCQKPGDSDHLLIPTSCVPLINNLSGPHFPHSFIHLLIHQYLLSAYEPGSVIGTGNAAVNKTNSLPSWN